MGRIMNRPAERFTMPVLHEPFVSLEEVKLRALSLSSLELEVMIRVQNSNSLGVTLRELPFTVLCSAGDQNQEIATGNTGRVKIPARGSTVLRMPVTSQNAALIGALATFVTRGGMQVTIQGTATIDCILFGWSIPFTKTLAVTMAQVAEAVAGAKPD
ncbi:MAG: LEA type 2 family protein [Methanoregula sp.]|nr:LEA type 2 family protein [Methanoregula sp.]